MADYSYTAAPLQAYSSMDQIKQAIRDSTKPCIVAITQNGCQACEKQIAELRKLLFYKNDTPVYKIQAREFNSALPEDFRIKTVPVIYKGHSSYGLRFGKNGIMALEELQTFIGS